MWKDKLFHVARPEKVQVLVLGDAFGNGVPREFLQHDIDVDQAVAPPVDQYDGSLDISGWELCNLVILASCTEAARTSDFVVEHLELPVADDLEPVNYTLRASEGIQVRVCSELLVRSDVGHLPAEEETQRLVDDPAENARVKNGLPHCRTAEHGTAAECQIEHFRVGLDQRADDSRGQTRRCHCGCQSYKDIDLGIQRRMDGKSSKCLSSPLTETNIRQAWLLRCAEDVIDRIRNIMEGKVVCEGVSKEWSYCTQ